MNRVRCRLAGSAFLAGVAGILGGLPAHANSSSHWGNDGSGACVAVSDWNPFHSFVPGNCQPVLGPSWILPASRQSGWLVSCSEAYWFSLNGYNSKSYSNSYTPFGVGWYSTSSHVTDDDYLLGVPATGTPSAPGYGSVSVVNWDAQSHHLQAAVGCLNGATPVQPSAEQVLRPPKPIYDFGEWEKATPPTKERPAHVYRQVVLDKGRTRTVKLHCPGGTVRSGGVDIVTGFAIRTKPDPKRARRLDVGFSTSPLRNGATARLEPKRLPYPTVVQLSLACWPR